MRVYEPIERHVYPIRKGAQDVRFFVAFLHTTLPQAFTSPSDFTANPKWLLSPLYRFPGVSLQLLYHLGTESGPLYRD